MDKLIMPFLDYEAKIDGDVGLVDGYASVFNNRDHGKDLILPGAFTKSLATRGAKVMYLPSHDYGVHVKDIPGVPVEIREDTKGLFTSTKFFLNTQAGKDSFTVLKEYQRASRPLGMSFTYNVTDYEQTAKGRNLKAVDLFEYGHTALPMNDEARTTGVKAYYSGRERQELAASGAAMPDGAIPIVTGEDLYGAIYEYQLGYSNREGAKEHIIARAQALSLEGCLPADWVGKGKKWFHGLTLEEFESPEAKAALAALTAPADAGKEAYGYDYYNLIGRRLELEAR